VLTLHKAKNNGGFMKRVIATVIVLTLILTGCSSGSGVVEDPAPPETNSDDSAFAIQTVKDRYESDCFAGLGEETASRYEASPGGTMREGFVYVSVGGNVLQFSVGTNENSGGFLTFPTNDLTIELLESVGC